MPLRVVLTLGTKFSVRCCLAKQTRLHGKFGLASGKNGVCGQNNVWQHCKFSTEKIEQVFGWGLLSRYRAF